MGYPLLAVLRFELIKDIDSYSYQNEYLPLFDTLQSLEKIMQDSRICPLISSPPVAFAFIHGAGFFTESQSST